MINEKRVKLIVEKFKEEYEKHNVEIKDSKNISEMCSNYARYCGHLEALLTALEIDCGVEK